MSHATLTFTLPEESAEFKLAANAGALQLVILDVDQALRNKIKHGTAKDQRLRRCVRFSRRAGFLDVGQVAISIQSLDYFFRGPGGKAKSPTLCNPGKETTERGAQGAVFTK